MSEHEIAKHTRAIYKAWNTPNQSWKHKLFEVAIEIGIIVFAISLTLFFERLRERQHNREIEREFLIGLKSDLLNDLKQQSGDSASYAQILSAWTYLRTAAIEKHVIPADTVKLCMPTLLNSTGFIPNSSRFEALKSSGELGVIQNGVLQNKILDLYQYKIRTMIVATDYFTAMKENHLVPFLTEKMVIQPDGRTNLNAVLQLPQMQNFMILGGACAGILVSYDVVMEQSREIIRQIDLQYDLAK